MFNIELSWKEFNVDLQSVKEWIDANLDATCVGISANTKMEIHFESEPSQADKDALQVYWNGIASDSDEAEEYKSAADVNAERLAKIASAKAKLQALGLTEAEVAAILGQ